MARISLRFAESAITDLEELRFWYTEQGVAAAGERVLMTIFTRIEALVDHPDMGRVVPEFAQSYLRELIVPPFRIVYRREPRHVRIVRVWRSERQLILPGADSL
jgi:toxin ParE1/3/4